MLGFRVWHIVRKCFIPNEEYFINRNGELCFPDYPRRHTQEYYAPKDVIAMQSTGLKDCNGVEIFEGDVLLARFRGTNYQKKITVDEVVEFVQYEYTCAEYSGVESLEIIGNKWQNPELLEKTSC